MRRIEATVVLTASLAVAACNGSNVEGSKGHITQGNGSQVAQKLEQSLLGSMLGRAGMPVSQGAAVRFTGGGDCWTVSGDQTDSDGDGVPDSVSITYTSCTDSYDGWTETYDGTETFSDPTANTSDWAYADVYDLTVAATDGTDSETDHMTGSDSFGPDGASWKDSETFADDYSGTYQGQAFSGHATEDWAEVYTPNGAWSPDQPLVAGTYTVTGDWSDTIDGQSVSASISTPDPLVIDPACDTYFVSGTVVATDGTNTETLTWTGCDQYTDTYSGS